MESTIYLRGVTNETGRDLDFFQATLHPIQVRNGTTTEIPHGSLELKTCAKKEDYVAYVDENRNLFFSVRQSNMVFTWILRIFDQSGNGQVAYIRGDRDNYDARESIAITRRNDHRPKGLYLTIGANLDEEPGPQNLWIVGEMVTDVAGGDDEEG